MNLQALKSQLAKLHQFAVLNGFYECTCGVSETVQDLMAEHYAGCVGERDFRRSERFLSLLAHPHKYVLFSFPSVVMASKFLAWLAGRGEQGYYDWAVDMDYSLPHLACDYGTNTVTVTREQDDG